MADQFLTDFIEAVENDELPSLMLTVFIGGTPVSGKLVSRRRYFAAMSRAAESGVAASAAPVITGENDLPEETELGKAEHLHLSKARWPSSAGLIPVDGLLLRVRIADVQAWALGSLAVAP